MIVFDLGGVLVELDPTWSRRVGLEDASEFLECAEFHAYERGTLSLLRVHRAFTRWADCSLDAFRDALGAWVVGPLPGAVELLDEVQASCLSNSNPVHWSLFDPDRALRGRMQHVLASHYLGARKPEPVLFERAEAILGRPALFLDDSVENVQAARAFGWPAERVVGVQQARHAIEAAGLLP